MTTIKNFIRTIPDHPQPGIQYRDISTLLRDGKAFQKSIDLIASWSSQFKPNLIAGIEARGFVFGSAVAFQLNLGFIPIRKKGKLPYKTISERYELEYGSDCLEVHQDAVEKGTKVVIVDDLLATGGTAEAAYNLVRRSGAKVVGVGFLIELPALSGREILEKLDCKVFSAVQFND